MVGVIRSYDDLSRKLWKLEGLLLTVTAVQGTHPALRYTDVSLKGTRKALGPWQGCCVPSFVAGGLGCSWQAVL